MNLADAFAASARLDLGKIALFWGEEEFSYGRLFGQTLWVAEQLRAEFKVQPGDRVGLWLKNCPQFVPALFGILQADAVVVPINNFLKPAEVGFILANAGVNVLITDESMGEGLAKLIEAQPGLQALKVEAFQEVSNRKSEIGSPKSTDSDLAVIVYTSGTTGHPKGAMLSHGNIWHNVESCRKVLEAVGEDRFVILLPMFHSFMMTVGVFLPLLVNGSVVVVKSLHPPKNILAEIIHRKATLLPAVPQFFRMLTNDSVTVDLPLRLCISGGAPLPGEILKEFTAKFPIPLLEGYGLSEASPVVSFNPLHGPWKAGSIGVPILDVDMSVQDDTGKILGPGETGEVCVRGGNVMQGYWQQPEETALVMRGEWLLTGDIGHVDADGYYFITDRKKDMLLVNGINVYPREIEEVLYQFKGVKEAAVIGVTDARKGEQAVAFLSMNEGASLDEKALLQFVRERLADYKVPKKVVVLPALPRNSTGKILKTALRKISI